MADGRLLFTAADAAAWCGGALEGSGSVRVYGAEVDSRKCTAGMVFFALPGERVDGHDYVAGVLEGGAAGAVVSKEWFESESSAAARELLNEDNFIISAEDSLRALQLAAAEYLKGVSGPVRIGVTGSNGKTTTKELIAGVLSEKYSVVKTAGNYNSEIGLPLTVFNIESSHDYAVIEMGINRVGEMDVLAEILRPDMVVITNIGTAHIGIFKTVETIAFEKRRAVSLFNGSGKLFAAENEPWADFLAEDLKGSLIRFGKAAVEAELGDVECENLGLKGWNITVAGRSINFPLLGEHNLQNAFCAAVVGMGAGLGADEIAAGLRKAEPLFGRSEIIEGPVTVIQDCYNANADSMLSSIGFADGLEWPGARRYVLGDMKELGENSRAMHVKAGRAAAECSAEQVFFFGEDSAAAYEAASSDAAAAKKAGAEVPAFFYTTDYDLLEAEVLGSLNKGDLLLLKGSRSMNLERLVKPVKEKFRRAEC